MSDAAIAYKHYRFYVTATPRNDYVTINQIELFLSTDRSAPNIVSPSTASATSSGVYESNTADKALTSLGFWESSKTTDPKWLVISFDTAKPVRAFRLTSTQFADELPTNFIVQGSNDNATWTELYNVTGNTATAVDIAMYLDLSGISKLDTGDRAPRVLVYNWLTGALIKSIVPNINGSWACPLRYDDEVFVTHLGTSGYEPKTDGPIKPYSRQ